MTSEIRDLIAAGDLCASSLRQVKPDMNNEEVKRWLLTSLGWKFNRKLDSWIEPASGDQINPNYNLEAVCAFLCARITRNG